MTLVLQWSARPEARSWTCDAAPSGVRAFHEGLPGYSPTPLVETPGLAAELGVGRVFVKDESCRLGLPAFKALGASWAIHRALAGRPFSGRLVTATDGNHGRAVARTARRLGLPAQIFVPEGVSAAAVTAIAGEGAEIVRVAGPYDEAVRLAAAAAEQPDTVLVQDTAWAGYEEIPGWIVEGYSTLFSEIDTQLHAAGAPAAGLVAVPVGVGSLAQAAITHYRSRPSGLSPAILSVEPETAACVLASLIEGRPVSIPTGTTTMAGLNCGTPSSLAWPYLRDGLDAAIAISDAGSAVAADDLAALGISSGPCGAASLAGTRAALFGHREVLGVSSSTTVVLLNTEGGGQEP